MIDRDYVRTMAAYNRWQNENVYGGAETLSDADRKRDRGAFFGSIHGTLNHILWADEVWMGRFAGRPHPTSPIARSGERYEDWNICGRRATGSTPRSRRGPRRSTPRGSPERRPPLRAGASRG